MWSFVLWMIIYFENVSSKTQPDDEQSEYRSGRFSVAFHILLPVAGLTWLLFGNKHLFTKLMLQLDRNCVSVFCPSLSKRDKLLKWACGRLPSTWSSKTTPTLSGGVADLWKDGSLLCTLLNTAVPGACPNPHRHWNQAPAHAQAIAYKYLGVIPIFTDEDLSGHLSPHLECRFIVYLNDIQQAVDKVSESSDTVRKVTSQYVARGMGLFSGEQHKKAVFYIYSADKENTDSGVIVQIKGPYGTYGSATIPLHEKLLKVPEVKIISEQVQSNEFLKPEPKSDFMESFSKYFKKYHQKHVGENIVIDVVIEGDRAKVTYVPKHFGMYEINMISNGELLKGCPFNIHIFRNDSEEDTAESEDKDENTRPYQKRKVISKTIDLIDEKIPLSELKEKYKAPEVEAEAEKATQRPKFNFIEVVEEITRNNEEFKDIFDLERAEEVTETFQIKELDEPSASSELNDGDLSMELAEPIVEEAEYTSSLEVGATRQYEADEVDENECLVNFNVEIQMPVIEEGEERESYLGNEAENIAENERDSSQSEHDSGNNRSLSTHGSDTDVLCEQQLAVVHLDVFSHIHDDETTTRVLENSEKSSHRRESLENLRNESLQCSDGGDSCPSEQDSGIDQDQFSISPDDVNPSKDSVHGRTLFHSAQFPTNHQSTFIETELIHSEQTSSLPNLEDENVFTESGIDVPDSRHHSVDCQDLSLHSINEEENFASVSDNESNLTDSEQHSAQHSSSRRDMMCNANHNNNSNKQGLIADHNSNVNSRAGMPIFTDQTGEEDGGKLNLQIGSKYMNNNINRIKIPDKFAENPKTIVKNNLVRYFSQKIVNSERSDTTVANKVENYASTKLRDRNVKDEDDVFLRNMVGDANKGELRVTPSRFSKPQDPPKRNPSTRFGNTSPICPDHIAPEVEFKQLSVADRRKIFAQNSRDSISSSKNSSFSEIENTDGSRTGSQYEMEGLSVLNVLDTLKQSESSINDSFSLSSAQSLPDISMESDGTFSDSVREKKNFWENVSRSSSSMSLVSTKKVTNELNKRGRCSLIWKKPTDNTPKPEETTFRKTADLYKSADDILSMTGSLARQNSKNYKSLDNSLNECETFTIDERKKLLLKQNYEVEKREREKLRSLRKKSVMLYDARNINKISEDEKVDTKIETRFSMIKDRIRKYNSASNLPTAEENNNSISIPKPDTTKSNNTGTLHQNDLLNPPETPKKKARSQFRLAIQYFQKLEEKSHGKAKLKKPKTAKKFSLEITSKKERNRRKGGSLNLPKISDRFSVNNLYDDVIGNKKGSFKGTPNRTALVEALATFSRKENSMYDFSESEDDIKYEIFKNHIKRRKRRSIRSIFDVYY